LPDPNFQSLFVAALISKRTDLNDQQRASIILACPKVNTYERNEIRSALEYVAEVKISESALKPQPSNWPSIRQIKTAQAQAQEWFDRGIFVLTAEQLHLPANEIAVLPPIFFAYGSRQVLNQPRAAILNSRKPRQIHPQSRWVQVARQAFQMIKQNDYGLATSLGNNPYELVCCLSKMNGQPTLIISDSLLPFMLPGEKIEAFLKKYDQMFPVEKTLFLSPFTPGRVSPLRQRAIQRDHCLVTLSSYILAAEIRADGNMERFISEAVKQGKTVKVFQPENFDRSTAGNKSLLDLEPRTFRLGADNVKNTLKIKHPSLPNQDVIQSNLENNSFLIHFTRSCPGPWPGETLYEYYKALLEGNNGAAHTAFDTLYRILSEQRIRGSDRLIRGQIPVVSFTAQPLKKLKELIRWRRGLIRWVFEPYGVAIAKNVLRELGACPVIYCGDEGWKQLKDDQKYRFQLHQPPDTNWTMEKEWRLPGDLDLKTIPKKDVRIILPSVQEARQIAFAFRCQPVLATG